MSPPLAVYMDWLHIHARCMTMPRSLTHLMRRRCRPFGITGLYITFVFGIGRFLRLSTQNRRMHIPYEDLPTATRLAALCQARTLSCKWHCICSTHSIDQQDFKTCGACTPGCSPCMTF